MAERIKVVHIPARTPYARKLSSEQVKILNGTSVPGKGALPRDLTLRDMLNRRPFTWFDVLHLHHVEFERLDTLRRALAECARARRRVVFTAHDTEPVFTVRRTYQPKLRTLAEWSVPFVCLTERSAATVRRWVGATTTVVPHGYVVAPSSVLRPFRGTGVMTRYLLFGSLRANRDLATVLYNWRFGRRQLRSTLSLLLRAPSRANLEAEAPQWELISAMAAAEPRLRVEIAPFPTDHEVAQAVAASEALVLPYRWGSHSGQLELAFDMGLLPVASDVGYLRDQYQMHVGLVREPVWFNWSDGAEYSYGERFLSALDHAIDLLREGGAVDCTEEFAEHRRAEHDSIIDAYHDLYSR